MSRLSAGPELILQVECLRCKIMMDVALTEATVSKECARCHADVSANDSAATLEYSNALLITRHAARCLTEQCAVVGDEHGG